jgi:hypothetical protein
MLIDNLIGCRYCAHVAKVTKGHMWLKNHGELFRDFYLGVLSTLIADIAFAHQEMDGSVVGNSVPRVIWTLRHRIAQHTHELCLLSTGLIALQSRQPLISAKEAHLLLDSSLLTLIYLVTRL